MKQTFFTRDLSPPELQKQLEDWFASSPGHELLELETACAERLMRRIFGHYLLAAGFPGDIRCSGIRLPVTLGGERDNRAIRVIGDTRMMPFQSDSIDAVLLAHALDFSAEPHQVLRETDRVLIPEGRVIIFGFNPYSIWGLRRVIRAGPVPWGASFLPRGRVLDWLRLLGFAIEQQEQLMFRPPLGHYHWMRGTRFMERTGARFWSPLAAVYVIQAVKRVSTITPIKPAWKLKRIIKPTIAEPTARSSHGR